MSNIGVNIRELVPVLWERLQGDGIGAVLARGASSSFAVSVFGAIMAFGTNVLLTRLMGVTQYGIYIYALTWLNLMAMVCHLGMKTSLLRFIPAYNAKQEWGLFRGILGRSVQYVLLASFITGITAAIIVWVLKDRIGADQSTTFWIAFLLLPLLSIATLRQSSLRALKRIIRSDLPDSFFRPLTIAILAGGMFIVSSDNLHATEVMLFNLVGVLIAFLIGTRWLIKALPSQVYQCKPVYSEREWLRVSLPLFFMSGMSLVLHKTDIIMIGVFLDTEQVGIYAIASRVAALMTFGLMAANAIVAPMISELYSTGQHEKLQRMVTLAARGIGVFTLLVFIFLTVFGKFMLSLFGEDFVMGYIPLVILLVGQTVNALAGSVGFLMSMTGHQNQAAKIVGLSAVVNIIANFILIPIMGTLGAAVATAGTTILWNLLMFFYVLKKLNINSTVLARLK